MPQNIGQRKDQTGKKVQAEQAASQRQGQEESSTKSSETCQSKTSFRNKVGSRAKYIRVAISS